MAEIRSLILTAKARGGNPRAAAEAMRYAAELLRERKPLPPALADFIAHGLLVAADGGTTAKAFALGKRKGLKPLHDLHGLWQDVLAAEREQPGMTRSAVFGLVAKRHTCDPETVKKAFYDYEKAAILSCG